MRERGRRDRSVNPSRPEPAGCCRLSLSTFYVVAGRQTRSFDRNCKILRTYRLTYRILCRRRPDEEIVDGHLARVLRRVASWSRAGAGGGGHTPPQALAQDRDVGLFRSANTPGAPRAFRGDGGN